MLFKEISDIFKHPGDLRDWKSGHTTMHLLWFSDKEKVLNCVFRMWCKVLDILPRKVINVIVSCHKAHWLTNLKLCYAHSPFLRKKKGKKMMLSQQNHSFLFGSPQKVI